MSFNEFKVQTENKTYNISQITTAYFGVETENRPLGDILTTHLLQAIAPFSSEATDICEVDGKWYNIPECMSLGKETLTESFSGILGNRLMTLMAIEKGSEPAEMKREMHIKTCMSTAKRTLQVIVIALISDLWNLRKEKQEVTLSETQAKSLQLFFGSLFEMTLSNYCLLLTELYTVYKDHKFEWPIPELTGCDTEITAGSLSGACAKLEQIFNEKSYTAANCTEAEKQLAIILCIFNFLARYKMVSIKNGGYEKVRGADELYSHRYIEIDNSNRAAQLNISKPASTYSIQLYSGKTYDTSIDLFPFIIDLNALKQDGGADIYFFSRFDKKKSLLDYRQLNNAEVKQEITLSEFVKPETPKTELEKLLQDEKTRKLIWLDTVFNQFIEARTAILGPLPA